MVRHQKMGAYEHFCVLIFAQGTWNDKDRESILKPLQEKHNEQRDDPYHLYLKLTRRDSKPQYSDCQICRPIYEMLEELKGQNDAILFQGHHYLILEDDAEDLKDFVAQKRASTSEFIKNLNENSFSSRTIYEITKY